MFGSLPSTLLLLFLCLCPVLADSPAPERTFTVLDPDTNRLLQCARCPPGTHLLSACTATHATTCSPCPRDTFTELWNYLDGCLRCRTCDWNQVVKTECGSDSNRQCQCRPGHYLEVNSGRCVPHSKCRSGEGARHKGSPDADTVCGACPAGSYSNRTSAERECVRHRSCVSEGLQRLLPGSRWHDSVCVKCDNVRSGEAAEHLRGLLPMFFTHHRIPHHVQQLVFNELQNRTGQTHSGDVSRSNLLDLQARIDTWVSSATATQLEELPEILREAKAIHTAEKLLKKLQRIKQNLKRVCG